MNSTSDCVQYKIDVNPCSDTYNTYRLFEVPCPPIVPESTDLIIGNDYVLYINNTINESFTIEIINSVNEKIIITISVEPNINEIYLKEGKYRICFYHHSNQNYVLKRVDTDQLIYANSCRDNIMVNRNYSYYIDYLTT